jgi:hypothetical protein
MPLTADSSSTLPATVAALRAEIEYARRAAPQRRDRYITLADSYAASILSVLARVEALCAVAEAAQELMDLTEGKAWPTRELWEAAGVLRTALATASGRASRAEGEGAK